MGLGQCWPLHALLIPNKQTLYRKEDIDKFNGVSMKLIEKYLTIDAFYCNVSDRDYYFNPRYFSQHNNCTSIVLNFIDKMFSTKCIKRRYIRDTMIAYNMKNEE